jgi:hypothetical protein
LHQKTNNNSQKGYEEGVIVVSIDGKRCFK